MATLIPTSANMRFIGSESPNVTLGKVLILNFSLA